MSELVLQFSTSAPDPRWSWVRYNWIHFPFRFLLDKNFASTWIRRANHSPFSHVDMMTDEGNMLGASDSPAAPVIEGNPMGVAVRPQGYQAFAYRRRMVLETDRADDIRRIAMSQLGKRFDNSSLKDFISDKFPGQRDWRLTDRWFCAELVAWSMEVGGFWEQPLSWPKNRVSPTDILLLCLTDHRWVNRDTFWLPVPGLQLGPHER